jgi:hypothetical protein
MARSPPMYSELKDDSASSPSLLSEHEDGGYEPRLIRRQWTTGRWAAVLMSLLFTNIASILITSHWVLSRHAQMTVFEPPTGIPPFFRNISLELRPELVYAPFYDRSDSIYRKHNSPETELAWRELTQLGARLVSSELMLVHWRRSVRRSANMRERKKRRRLHPGAERASQASGHRPNEACILERS